MSENETAEDVVERCFPRKGDLLIVRLRNKTTYPYGQISNSFMPKGCYLEEWIYAGDYLHDASKHQLIGKYIPIISNSNQRQSIEVSKDQKKPLLVLETLDTYDEHTKDVFVTDGNTIGVVRAYSRYTMEYNKKDNCWHLVI
jgi:hypothetical protein